MQGADTPAAADLDTEDLYTTTPDDEPGGDEGEEQDGDQPRDEHGRFASKEKSDDDDEGDGDGEGDQQEPDKGKAEGEDRDGGQIPSWRLREIREERDRIAAEKAAAEARAAEYERRLAAYERQQRQQQEAEQTEVPDPIVDPQGYDRYVRSLLEQQTNTFQATLRKQRVDDSFDAMFDKHGEPFDKAVEEFIKTAGEGGAKDRALFGRIVDSRNPGRALWSWYQDRRTMAEIGGDLDGYKKRLRDELKKDPEFRKEFMADLEGEARGGGDGRSPNVTTLPSLSRAPGGAHRGDAEEMDTESLYAPARGRR